MLNGDTRIAPSTPTASISAPSRAVCAAPASASTGPLISRGAEDAVAGALPRTQAGQPAAEPYDTHAKMNPPLRAESDRQAVAAALEEGIIDAIATDHAPHGALDKQVEFVQAANGIIGLETSLALTLALVRSGELSLTRALERLTVGPARCFELPYGTLGAGVPADVIVVDAEREWKVDPLRSWSKSRNTPFTGWTLRGKVVKTFVAGKLVHEEGK